MRQEKLAADDVSTEKPGIDQLVNALELSIQQSGLDPKETAFQAFRKVKYGEGGAGFGAAVDHAAASLTLPDLVGEEPGDVVIAFLRKHEEEYLEDLNKDEE